MNAGMQNLISELGSCYPRSLPSKENHYERGRGSGTFTAPSAGTQPTLDIVPPSPLSQASDSWLIEDLSDTESHRRSEQACPGFVEFLQESVPSSPFSQASNCWRIGDLFETERHEQSEQACPGSGASLRESRTHQDEFQSLDIVPSSSSSEASICWRIGDRFGTEEHEQSEQACPGCGWSLLEFWKHQDEFQSLDLVPLSSSSEASDSWRIGDFFDTESYDESKQPPEQDRYPQVPSYADDTSTFVWQNNLGSTSSPEEDDDVFSSLPLGLG